MVIGNNVRIDDFCILSGRLELGNYVHIAAGVYLYGDDVGIDIKDYSTISSHGAVYAVSDDYSGASMTNPMIPEQFKQVIKGKIEIGKHVIIGAQSTILPDVIIGEGCAIGAHSLVNKALDSWGIYAGSPCRKIRDRSKELLESESKI